ncbi:hypothetical protein [Pantoea agglomerans]|uniref:hypothetical protein n=1 Tax=Enterobacter agglomerans TaxID=549 RepID=UPI00301A3816
MNTVMPMPAILSQHNPSDNIPDQEKPVLAVKKSRTSINPFIRAGNVTGIALEFFVRQMASRFITRTAADFLTKICNVAAASEAYQIYYSKATMAVKAGVCTKSVQRYMRVIEASGIMVRTAVTDSIKGHQPNVYTFNPSFIAAARSFFTEKLSSAQIKGLRSMAQQEISRLVDTALEPFKNKLRRVLSLDAARAFFKAPPIGQSVPTPTGQCDPQEVEEINQEKENKNLTRPGSKWFHSFLKDSLTGKERRALTNAALIETRKKRDEEQAQLIRSRHARKKHAERASVTSEEELIAMGWNTGRNLAKPQFRKPFSKPMTGFNHARMDAANREHDAALESAKASAQRDPEVIRGHIQGLNDMLKGKICR